MIKGKNFPEGHFIRGKVTRSYSMPDAVQMSNGRSHREPSSARMLLDLFSSETPPQPAPINFRTHSRRALWAADALHRANNLAQMASFVDVTSERFRGDGALGRQGPQERVLSRAYAELAVEGSDNQSVPCRPLLETIATRLVALFRGTRPIDLHFHADDVLLPREQRRALTLIASELIINALKYAFPTNSPKAIAVTLARSTDAVDLTVADNGCGLPVEGLRVGSGSALMLGLAALLHAELVWIDGDGLTAKLAIPIAH